MSTELQFFDKMDKLSTLLSQHGDSPSALSEAKELLLDPDVRREFLRTLQNPTWIEPLHQAGYFVHPPSVMRTEAGYIQSPLWPESRYLARMAVHAPAEVATIFAAIETDNVSVIGDMLHAALAMPTDVASSLVPAINRAAREGTLWIRFKDASDLCVRLVEGAELDVAMTLADALFTPAFEKGQEEPTRRDEYWYKSGLAEVVPVLAARKPYEFLPKLCDWLKASVDAKKHVDPAGDSDYSYIWRPAIEEHEQNHDYDFAGAMVGFVREGFEKAIRKECLPMEEALEILEQYPYLVFKRLRVHLIGEFADQSLDLAHSVILNREMFADQDYKHEYAMLVGRRLDLLSPRQRDEWFGWIDAGPDMSDFDDDIRTNFGREATDADREDRVHYWQFQKLHWVRDHLDGDRRVFYKQMLATHGEPEMADLNVRVGSVRWGHDSPMTADDLAAMTFQQAVEAVSSWQPEELQDTETSIEGLASTFRQYVATDPEQFSAEAQVMVDRPAIFIRGYISEMGEATKAGRKIDICAVLDLCHWVVTRPVDERTTPKQGRERFLDKNWQWTRDEISRFVENVCKARTDNTPKYPMDDIRQPIWKLIECLCHDRAESHVVREEDPRVHDYLDLAINSPRGKAVEAALEYARWVGDHIKRTDGKKAVVPGGFDALPEIREMLEWQIAPENRSLAAMAVIGSRIGVISWIDSEWLTENAGRLFQLQGIEQDPCIAKGWAAWNAFLVWVRPHIEFYRAFKSQFAYAVEQSSRVELPERAHQQPMSHLGEHLMLLYGRGQLSLDDDEGLLRRFLDSANPDVRRHAIRFVGRSLDGEEKVRVEIVERFMLLWDVYWTGHGKNDAEEKPSEWLFGTWFTCGQFPELWALDRLEQFVMVVPTPEPDHIIAEKLAEIAHVDLVKSVRILDSMVRGDREGWRIDGWLESAEEILEQAMEAPREAREQAVALINHLGRRGYADFGKILRRYKERGDSGEFPGQIPE